jgi:hypothetical protein
MSYNSPHKPAGIRSQRLSGSNFKLDVSLQNKQSKETGSTTMRSVLKYLVIIGVTTSLAVIGTASAHELNQMNFSNPMAQSIDNYEAKAQAGNLDDANTQSAIFDQAPDSSSDQSNAPGQ